MSIKLRFAACAAFASFACTSFSALADDHAYTEGQVVNVSRIRAAASLRCRLNSYTGFICRPLLQRAESTILIRPNKGGCVVEDSSNLRRAGIGSVARYTHFPCPFDHSSCTV